MGLKIKYKHRKTRNSRKRFAGNQKWLYFIKFPYHDASVEANHAEWHVHFLHTPVLV